MCISMNVYADDVDATFEWTQTDYDKVNYWILSWGVSSGGPYTVKSVQIPKSIIDPEQMVPVIIQYPANAKTTYYYVLRAFVDAEHFSGNSNEVFLEIDFIYTPQDPVQLKVLIIPGP